MNKLRLLGGAVMALLLAAPAQADTVVSGTFLSDHCDGVGGCTGSGQPGGFGTITVDDHLNGTIDVSISLNNGNTFANGGFGAVFAFNLVGNPTITYSNLNTTVWDVAGSNDPLQNAGSIGMDGFGTFEYGVDAKNFNGGKSTNPSSLSFTISGTGLSIASFAELSTNPPGNLPAFMTIDLFSGNNGNTGIVDLSGANGTPFSVNPVPGPIAGAGLPGLLTACLGLIGLHRRRRRRQVA